MRSGLICPATETPCADGRCKVAHCVIEAEDRIARQRAEAKKADAKWLWDTFSQLEIRRFYQD